MQIDYSEQELPGEHQSFPPHCAAATQRDIPVCGWIFNDHFLSYEQDIVGWSGYPLLGVIPFAMQSG